MPSGNDFAVGMVVFLSLLLYILYLHQPLRRSWSKRNWWGTGECKRLTRLDASMPPSLPRPTTATTTRNTRLPPSGPEPWSFRPPPSRAAIESRVSLRAGRSKLRLHGLFGHQSLFCATLNGPKSYRWRAASPSEGQI